MDRFPDGWEDVAWAKVPRQVRDRAVAILRSEMGAGFLEDVRARIERDGRGKWTRAEELMGWHFGQGMAIRNLLRSPPGNLEGIKDDELPGLPEFYGEDQSTWDDFYVQALEAAAGARPEED